MKRETKNKVTRVITYLLNDREDGTDIYLITMFDKSQESSIKKDLLVKLVNQSFN